MKEFLVSGLRKLVEQTADEFEPGVLDVFTAERALAEWAAIERIACAAKLRTASRTDDLGLDAEQAVANASGVTTGQAKKQTRLRKKLAGKSQTTDAFDKGKLSTTQADAIADAVDVNPSAETKLLDLAETVSASDLLTECERVKRDALDADGSLGARQRAARCLRTWTDGLGMTVINGRFEPVAGAKLVAELERRADRFYRAQAKAGGVIDTQEQRLADALSDIVNAGDGVETGKRRGPRTEIHLLVTKSAVDRGWLESGEKCETAQGKPIPLSAVDEALMDPDTRVRAVVFDEVDVRSIITYTRYWPKRVEQALIARGLVCEVPGCGRCRGLQKDHHYDFAKGGPTSVGNGGWKCHPHHKLKSRGLYDLWTDEHGTTHWSPTRDIPPHARPRAPNKGAA